MKGEENNPKKVEKEETCSCGCCHDEGCDCDHVTVEDYEALRHEAEQYLGLARQFQADFDNYRKRTQQQLKDARIDGRLEALNCIFPAIDSLAKAKTLITDKQTLSGIKMIEDEIIKNLKTLKVEKIKAKGHQFDPSMHNAIAIVEDSKVKPNTIIEEIQAGFTCDGKVIKYSQVIVNKA